ncbi:hypothetical protein [Granulicella sibirica]|uniref:Response regulatory domain-containing protein n=1 Tax=Granulicella sibirica TaxID=2479048 RepID=A0A4Q0SUM6_9BACT|nr:hypothetical protein [Granulicella sibirica]RXH54753.1 hypothetical protein GRAN_3857 [Granulicella sibirica]
MNQDRALNCGARIFLQKPVKNAELLRSIERILESGSDPDSVVYDLDACKVATHS